MWSEDLDDDAPFLEQGLAREARSEASRCKVARSIGYAGGIIALTLMLGAVTHGAFDHHAAVDKVVALSDAGYDCLGKADVLDDMGKEWCCSKGLIPCGEASRLAADNHDLFSEDLPQKKRGLLEPLEPHFSSEDVSENEAEDDREAPTEEQSAEVYGLHGADAESGYPFDSYGDAPLSTDSSFDWHGATFHHPIDQGSDWHEGTADSAFYHYPADSFSDSGGHDHVVVHHHIYTGDHFYQPVHFVTHTSSSSSSSSKIDCHAGLRHYKTWSVEMKAHCCKTQQVGCEPMEFHCEETKEEHKWSSKQKAFCCATAGKGCPKAPFSCHTSSVNQPFLWVKERREWCCLHAKVGCPSFNAPYNCKAGGLEDRKDWSPGKKHWCCDHFYTGCSEERKTLYECKASAHNMAAWPDLQKAWCCHHEQVGCASSSKIMAKYDCLEGFSNWQRGWSSKKKAWCCVKAHKGCEVDHHYACDHHEEADWSEEEKKICCDAGHCRSAFDCKAGYDHWKILWTSAKQDWCCGAYGRACPSHDKYDCSHTAQLHTWSESQIMWCCQHRHAGCFAQRPFDCMAGYSNFQRGWSSQKKNYCCEHFQMACEKEGDHYEHLEELHTSKADAFDCTAGYENFQHGWSEDKKGFCCNKYQLGCPKGWHEQSHFGHHWSNDWSQVDHHVWASGHGHEGHGHFGPGGYDCVTDYEHWQVSWSSKRAEFCCQTYSVACKDAD